jgi:pyruvate formate-lyase activating enzyme-like uncharacterized protein
VIFANERQLKDEDDTIALIEEAKACKSKGAGFTGGDPLARIERTCRYIKLLKKEFGKSFHIHLYTIMETLSTKNLRMLEDAGLDELRLHPDFTKDKNWKNVELLSDKRRHKYGFDLGVEIPCIPGYEDITMEMIDYFIGKIYLALKLLKYCQEKYPRKNVHYCTCKLKDGVQLRERLKLRAENTKKIFDIVTDDGTFIRGVIYLHNLKPTFGYKTIISNILPMERTRLLNELYDVRKSLINEFGIPSKMLSVDEQKLRIITNIGVVRKLAKHLHFKRLIPAIVEQYPTWDQMEVDVEFL